MHLMTTGQLNTEVTNVHFQETSNLKYDKVVTDIRERENF
jgi:hypothetical protein